MLEQQEAQKAITGLNNAEMDGQVLKVKEARTREDQIRRAYKRAASL